MTPAQKAVLVDDLSKRLTGAPLVVLADYRGITVEQIDALRRAMDAAGVEYRVVKNKLAKRAIAGTPMEGLGGHLKGMTGWVIANEEAVPAAKALRDATKGLQKDGLFVVKGGYFDGEVLDEKAILKVADLPSKEELLSQLLATMQEAPRQILGVIQGPARDLLVLLKNYENKLNS